MSDLFHAELRTFRAQYLSAIEAGKVVNLLPTIMKGHLQKHTEEQSRKDAKVFDSFLGFA